MGAEQQGTPGCRNRRYRAQRCVSYSTDTSEAQTPVPLALFISRESDSQLTRERLPKKRKKPKRPQKPNESCVRHDLWKERAGDHPKTARPGGRAAKVALADTRRDHGNGCPARVGIRNAWGKGRFSRENGKSSARWRIVTICSERRG